VIHEIEARFWVDFQMESRDCARTHARESESERERERVRERERESESVIPGGLDLPFSANFSFC
jgi:hypothetical protein